MATSDNGTPKNQHLVPKIDHSEITNLKVRMKYFKVVLHKIEHLYTFQFSGEGTFGVVYRGEWRGKYVAVKYITKQPDGVEFDMEVRQLSRVSHENIVCLYGVCTNGPKMCLVMEYADGGSLYNALHGPKPKLQYTLGHALSWAYQCAKVT